VRQIAANRVGRGYNSSALSFLTACAPPHAKPLATGQHLAYFSVSSRSSLIKEWATRSALFLYLALAALGTGVHGKEPVIGGY
jgi:hypothetical protein